MCAKPKHKRIMSKPADILETIARYRELGIEEQIDYKKFYLYSTITHSTAIEGSTVTEIENEHTTLQPYNLTSLMREILVYCKDWHAVGEIAEHFKRSRQYIRGEVLPKLLDLLERKYDTPNHPHQQYRTKEYTR